MERPGKKPRRTSRLETRPINRTETIDSKLGYILKTHGEFNLFIRGVNKYAIRLGTKGRIIVLKRAGGSESEPVWKRVRDSAVINWAIETATERINQPLLSD